MDISALKGKIKLIALDLDGTTLRSDRSIGEKTKSSIQNAMDKGAYVVIVSGRPPQGILSYAKELNLKTHSYCICLNGSALFKLDEFFKDGDIVLKEDFNPLLKVSEPLESFMPVYYEAKALKLKTHAFSVTRSLLLEDDNPISVKEARLANLPIKYIDYESNDKKEEFYKLISVGEKELVDKLRTRVDSFSNLAFDVVRTDPVSLEFVAGRYNKGLMLLRLLDILGISKDEAIAFGDAENDLAMIESVGIGVAMQNAMEILKAKADYITKSNDEEGVAFVLDQIF